MRVTKIIQVPGLPIHRQPGPELPKCDGEASESFPLPSPVPLPEGFECDPQNPPPLVEVSMGESIPKEVQCRMHFLKRTKKDEENGRYYNGYFYITALREAPPGKRCCYDCVHNP